MSNNPAGYVKSSFEQTSAYYLNEINQLGRVAAFPFSDKLLSSFGDYQSLLRIRKKSKKPLIEILDISGGTRILSIDSRSPYIWEVFSIAHLAACCELLEGAKIPRHQMNQKDLTMLAQKKLSSFQNITEEMIINVTNKIHTMDTVRTMHLLRALGLVTKPSEGFYQLGLGAGSGFKDMYSLHKTPVVKKEQVNGVDMYYFNILQEKMAHIVVSDMDSQHRDSYKELNKLRDPPVIAINKGTNDVLEELNGLNIRKRNLVTSIRFDHRMIPDTAAFFKLLAPVIDDQCDLVMSMGSGDEPVDFEGRIKLMKSLFDELNNANLRPVLIKLHRDGGLMEQHASLEFGNSMSSTYEILYCKLQKKQLLKKTK